MKEHLSRFFKSYRKAFVPVRNQLRKELTTVESLVNKKLAETNCQRIIAVSPLFFLMYVGNIIMFIRHRDMENFELALVLTGIVTVFTCVMVGVMAWIMFFNKIDNEKEVWKFKLSYRLFWPVWFVCMAILSCLQMENGYMGVELLTVCLIANLVPLYNLAEFVVNLVVSVSVILLVAWNDAADGMLISTKMELTYFTAMQVLGYLVQRMQLMLWRAHEFLYMEAFIDPLTELLNRRGGNAMLSQTISEQRPGTDVGVIMFDIDYFKRYNDTFGHDAGDACLRMVGQTIRETFTERTQIMIRHGGEEFAVILFDTNEAELWEWAEKLRRAVYEKRLEAPTKEVAEYVTVSIGVALKKLSDENQRYEELLTEADAALYEAKRAGRNQVAYLAG